VLGSHCGTDTQLVFGGRAHAGPDEHGHAEGLATHGDLPHDLPREAVWSVLSSAVRQTPQAHRQAEDLRSHRRVRAASYATCLPGR